MAARPRMTVRLSPSRLHQLAWLAGREGWPPAEYARVQLTSVCEQHIAGAGLQGAWERDYAAWQAVQGRRPGKAESPDQHDYDRLAERGPAELGALPPKKYTAETLTDLALDPRVTGLPRTPGPDVHYEREAATIVRSLRPDGRKRRI